MFLIRIAFLLLLLAIPASARPRPLSEIPDAKVESQKSAAPTTPTTVDQLTADLAAARARLAEQQTLIDAAQLDEAQRIIRAGFLAYPADVRAALLKEFVRWAISIRDHSVRFTP